MRKFKIIILVVSMFFFSQNLYAGLIGKPRKARRSLFIKKDGAKSSAVASKAWKNKSLEVSNWSERRYDDNSDGMLQPSESRELLQDRYQRIKSRYPARVTNSVEAQYDSNKDGVLSKAEIDSIAKDIL